MKILLAIVAVISELACVQVSDGSSIRYGARAICDHTTPPTIEKFWSKGVAMYAYGVSVYYAYTGCLLNGPVWSCLK